MESAFQYFMAWWYSINVPIRVFKISDEFSVLGGVVSVDLVHILMGDSKIILLVLLFME